MDAENKNPAFFAIARVLGGHNVETLESRTAVPYNKYIISAFPNNKPFGLFKDKQDLVEQMQGHDVISVVEAIYELNYGRVLEIYNKVKDDKTKPPNKVYFDSRDVGEIVLLPKPKTV